jgi:cytochrome oxidase Cu insertion factor (SCO1/SenC/PrrC family)
MFSARRRAQLGLFAAAVVLATSVTTLIVAPRRSKPVAVADIGTLAPDFQLRDVQGVNFTLSEQRGHAVVLFFGSVKCPKTAAYNARVDRLARDFAADARVKVVALDVTSRGETPLDRYTLALDPVVAGRSFATLCDEKGLVASRYSANETPTFVLIDTHGVVRYRGAFDNSADVAFATQPLVPGALADVLGTPTTTLASFRP